MSDPMTNLEIEDVLSSIRRLVSEDLRSVPSRPARVTEADGPTLEELAARNGGTAPESAFDGAGVEPAEDDDAWEAEQAADADVDLGAGAEAQESDAPHLAMPEPHAVAEEPAQPLVLTPALRVVAEPDRALRASLEQTIAELEAAIAGTRGEWEPDGSEMPATALDFSDFDGAETEVWPEAEDGPEAEDEPVSDGRPAPAPDRAEADPSLHAALDRGRDPELRRRALERAGAARMRLVAGRDDAEAEADAADPLEWSAPGTDTDIETDAERDSDPDMTGALAAEAMRDDGTEAMPLEESVARAAAFWAAEAEDLADLPEPQEELEAPMPTADPVDEATEPEPPMPGPEVVVELQRAVDPAIDEDARLAGAVAAALATPGAAGAAAGDPPRRLHLGPGAERPVVETMALADLPEADSGEDDEIELFDGEPAEIDEEALRALIADIIRQELRGTLGERITRSVRKLVRREIQRALESRALD